MPPEKLAPCIACLVTAESDFSTAACGLLPNDDWHAVYMRASRGFLAPNIRTMNSPCAGIGRDSLNTPSRLATRLTEDKWFRPNLPYRAAMRLKSFSLLNVLSMRQRSL